VSASIARAGVCVLACALSIACSSQRVPTRAQVLRSLIERVALPEARAVDEAQTELNARLAELERAPEAPALHAVQTTWKRALLAWECARAFRIGPVIESRALLRAMFWPVRSEALESMRAESSSFDAARIDRLGVDVRGMFALEWLLFGKPAQLLQSVTPEGAHARALSSALAQNVQRYAQTTRKLLGDGSALTASLNSDEQQSVSRFVDLMIITVEGLTNQRLAPLLQPTAAGKALVHGTRGELSGMSSELVVAQLTATSQLYLGDGGPGLGALVKTAAPAIDQHLRLLFRAALAAVRALDEPLERVAAGDPSRIVRAHAALKDLERALKSELTSALGVTLTFESGDED
jgi:predicted lipoprotein